ncbi:hypothetical protein VTO42DRAFT_1467 [Malbranchea cinnamomea]
MTNPITGAKHNPPSLTKMSTTPTSLNGGTTMADSPPSSPTSSVSKRSPSSLFLAPFRHRHKRHNSHHDQKPRIQLQRPPPDQKHKQLSQRRTRRAATFPSALLPPPSPPTQHSAVGTALSRLRSKTSETRDSVLLASSSASAWIQVPLRIGSWRKRNRKMTRLPLTERNIETLLAELSVESSGGKERQGGDGSSDVCDQDQEYDDDDVAYEEENLMRKKKEEINARREQRVKGITMWLEGVG